MLIHDTNDEVQRVAAEIQQVHQAMQIVQKESTNYRILDEDLEVALKRYWKLTGQYFFVPVETKRDGRMFAR